ncbi:hypothetical protein G6F68_018261 [Rhizopus microsporus]|nr:hypothetical protein G6F68_018261 [Rhizopus microsporus]
MTKYIGILNRSLKEYNAFFQEHAQAFLNPATTPANVTLPSLHARLQGSVLSLIDRHQSSHTARQAAATSSSRHRP